MFGSKNNQLITDTASIAKVLERRLEKEGIFPSREEAIKRLASAPQRIYLGIDPTGSEIHLGHTISILFLKELWQLGHKPVIVIGDFTARIGDPTGKDATRKPLSHEEVRKNAKTYFTQLTKILPRGSFEVKYNGDWLDKLNFADVVQLASHVTVQQLLKRDMFQERVKAERPIGLHEFMYPLMQGFDSVAMNIDGEVGGNDQTFNMLVGRELEKKLLNKDKLVFATRLLVSETGKKMSKSEGTLIAVNDKPDDMFGKVMAGVPDDIIDDVFQLCTEKDQVWLDQNRENIKNDPYRFKKELGRELVAMYYDKETAEQAQHNFESVFSEGNLPEKMDEFSGAGESILDFIVKNGLVQSRSEAKSLLEQSAVKVNKEVVKEWGRQLSSSDIVQVGPKKFAKVK
ncbi:MAG TPA: tyrosine--tRNA ligase [Candidatus Paceibacterota bacterium]|nr:tyrosine--tRNA ligase [Candidatus Paceibacterota bacterium]